MSGTIIKKCPCKSNPIQTSDYQDQKYGKDMRVMSLDQKKTEATCSICNKTHKV